MAIQDVIFRNPFVPERKLYQHNTLDLFISHSFHPSNFSRRIISFPFIEYTFAFLSNTNDIKAENKLEIKHEISRKYFLKNEIHNFSTITQLCHKQTFPLIFVPPSPQSASASRTYLYLHLFKDLQFHPKPTKATEPSKMTFLGLFGSKTLDHEEYERQLTALSRDIAKTRNQLTFLHRKRASVRTSLIMYLTVAYLATVAYRYRRATAGIGLLAAGKSIWQLFVMCLLSKDMLIAFLAPLAVGALVYLVDTFFRWWIHNKEKHLKVLMKRHREKLEELKLKTNFSKTNLLLQRFDSSVATTSELSSKGVKQAPKLPKTVNASDKESNQGQVKSLSNEDTTGNNGKNGTGISQTNRGGLVSGPGLSAVSVNGSKNGALDGGSSFSNASPQNPLGNANTNASPAGWAAPVKKSFHDRILDLIIGSEHNETVESRYALICAKCYTHNGLAPPGCTDPFTIVYFCRNCSFMNGNVEGHKAEGLDSGKATAIHSRSSSVPQIESEEKSDKRGDGGRLDTNEVEVKEKRED